MSVFPLKLQGELSNGKYCEHLYNLHTNFPILQQMEELQGRILDANYTKADIDVIVDELDIQRPSKRALKSTLKKFPKLFGACLDQIEGRFKAVPRKVLQHSEGIRTTNKKRDR